MIQQIRTTTMVRWKEIKGFPGYYVSNNGLVKKGTSLVTIKIKKKDNCNYKYVVLRNTINKPLHDIHRLVWDHFGSEPHRKGMHIHHKDENWFNNHIDNLVLIPIAEHRQIHLKTKAA